MAYQVPSDLPESLTAGASWRWTRTLSEFPPSEGWTFTTALLGAGGTSIKLVATVDGANYLVTASTSQTTGLVPGDAVVTEYVENAGTRYVVGPRRTIRLLYDPTSALPGAQLSQAATDLALVRAAITAFRAGGMVQSYSIAGRSVTRVSLREMKADERALIAQVEFERTGGIGRPVEFRFGRPATNSAWSDNF